MLKTTTAPSLLPVDTEVEILRYSRQNDSPYNHKMGRVVGVDIRAGLMWVILDDDPIPRWRHLGILCYPNEVRSIET